MSRFRFVLDANVIVSALILSNSTPRQAFDRALNNGELLVSIPVLREVSSVLARKKFDKYVLDDERKKFLALFAGAAEFTEIVEEIRACRDPKDNKYLELAVSGDASLIITGDRDLLVLNPFRDIQILTPQEFLASALKS